MTLDNKDDEFEMLDSEEFDDEEELKNELVDEDDTIDGPVFEPSFDVDEEEIPFEEDSISDSEELSDISDDNDIKNETSNEIPSRKKDNMVSSEMSNNEKDSKDKKDTSNDNKIGESNNKDESSGNEKKDDNIIPDKKEEKKDPGEKTLDKNKDNKDKDNLNKKDSKNGDKNSNVKDLPKDKATNAGKVAGAAKDKAKDAAASKAKDAAGGLSKKAPKGASKISDKKDIADNTKNAIKKGPKGLVGSSGVRAALAASENTNAYSKAAATVIKVMDNIIGKDRVDWILDKFGERTLKHTMVALIIGLIHAFMPFLLLLIGIYLFFAPLLDVLMAIDTQVRNLANTAEKFKNLVRNGMYADSKEAFNEEFDRLSIIFGEDLDQPLLLSSTFYADLKNGYQTRYDNIGDIIADKITEGEKENMLGIFSSIIGEEIDSIVKESNETYDPDTGLTYTVGKVYRLRQLAEHMFGDEVNGKRMLLADWYEKTKIRKDAVLEETIYKMAARLGWCALGVAAGLVLTALGVALVVGVGVPIVGSIIAVVGLALTFLSAREGFRAASDIIKDVKMLMKFSYMGMMSTDTILFGDSDCDGEVSDKEAEALEKAVNTEFGKIDEYEIELESDQDGYDDFMDKVGDLEEFLINNTSIMYYSPKYDETKYKNYLREVYIPQNPDFEPFYSYDENGNPTQASIDRIVNEIYEYSDYFKQLFYPDEVDIAEKYSEQCLGAIDKRLAAALEMPVDINTTNCIDFSGDNGYGYRSNGLLHNGIEINAKSTGNVEGDKVYAVLDNGTVVSSSADDTPMTCVGGCIEIQYSYLASGYPFDFSIVYKGLHKESVTLKSGDKVTKRQQVGTIGTADESEDMGISSLYIEFRTVGGMAIDPTNMIVKCNGSGIVNYEGGNMVNIPQAFQQTTFHTVTCFGDKRKDVDVGFYKSCSYDNPRNWGTGEGQKMIYELWVKQGKQYKNGIAVINVDGTDRYLVAVTRVLGTVGTVINATFGGDNETVTVPMLVMDEKDQDDCNVWKDSEGKGWGHATCNKGTLDVSNKKCNQSDKGELVCDPAKDPINVIEAEVDIETYKKYSNVKTSKWGVEWDTSKPLISVKKFGRILTDDNKSYSTDFDLSGSGSGNSELASEENYIASNGLQLCYPVGTSSKIDQYLSKAMEYANDDKIGWDSSKRDLNPNVDCSSFVYYSLLNSGVIQAESSAFDTTGMGKVLVKNGFEEYDYNESELQRGDIIVDPRAGNDGHTVIYLGDGKEIAAHSNRDGKDGDSDGKEVCISDFNPSSHKYTKYYRVKYDPEEDEEGSVPGVSHGVSAGTEIISYKNEKYVAIKTTYPGSGGKTGVLGYADMLEKNNINQKYKYCKGEKCEAPNWKGCCLGFAQTAACGLYYGREVTLNDKVNGKKLESLYDGQCNSNPTPCAGNFRTKCFATEAEMTTYIETRIQLGKPILVLVSTGNISGVSKKEFNKKTNVDRHWVTVVGFKDGSMGTDSLDLIYIDSYDSTFHKIGEKRYILKNTNASYHDNACTDEKPYIIVDFE